MRLFRHDSDGFWLGCAGIVAAETAERAAEIVRARLDASGLVDDKVNLHELPLVEGIVYFDTGDY